MSGDDPDKQTLAEDRTDFAEDRTSMANERTFAGWARTAMAAIGIGLGFKALFGTMEPSWVPKAISTIFILLAIFLVVAAERRACAVVGRLSTHSAEQLPQMNLRIIAVAISVACVVLVIGLWVLV